MDGGSVRLSGDLAHLSDDYIVDRAVMRQGDRGWQLPLKAAVIQILPGSADETPLVEFRVVAARLGYPEGSSFCLTPQQANKYYPGSMLSHFNT